MDTLTNKVFAITGGNSGIGRATAHELVRRGARVAILGRDEQTLAAARRELGEATLAFAGEVTHRDDLRRFFDAVAQQFDRLDGLFANAGIAAFAPIEAVTEEHIASMLDVNFSGAVRTIQHALPLLHDGASIVLNSSMYAAIGVPGSSIYTASKAALESLARTLSAELAGRGIRVNAIAPATSQHRSTSGSACRPPTWPPRWLRKSIECRSGASGARKKWPAPWPSCSRQTLRMCWAKPWWLMAGGAGCERDETTATHQYCLARRHCHLLGHSY
jgi:NAD(P)-dependent dehydrogenase (short-subunit alcohol dehydrogenase family)